VPRLSLWKNAHSNDYKFIDRRVSEIFTIGGTGVYLHKYLGSNNYASSYTLSSTANANVGTLSFSSNIVSNLAIGQVAQGPGLAANTTITAVNTVSNTVNISINTTESISTSQPISIFWRSADRPVYTNQTEQNIQDLLFLENRDRKYDSSIYSLRGIYQVSDHDYDLSQFGLFLNADTVLMTFHLNDTVAALGRKILAGDVVELPHLTDYYPLDNDIPLALKRFYVVQEVIFAAEGFSQTWWPHLIRVKLTPLVDSQEYKDIINKITGSDETTPVGNYLSNYDKLININDAIINQAETDVPASGYDTSPFYIGSRRIDHGPGDTLGVRTDSTGIHSDSQSQLSDAGLLTPQQSIKAYLGGDGVAPNGLAIAARTSFPAGANIGDYVLRTDYLPNRLFRYDGRRWVKIEDVERTDLTPNVHENLTQREYFRTTDGTYTGYDGRQHPTQVSLSKGLTPEADN
jgi:hypothetical protein